jgi:hypothetical protein
MGNPSWLSVRRRSVDDLHELRQLADDALRLDGYPPRVPKDLGKFIAAPDALASFVALGDERHRSRVPAPVQFN